MRKFAALLSFVCLFSIFVQSVAACGPFTVDPVFSLTRHADYPLKNFANGKIGIVPTSYGRMSLFIFYRQLNNLTLSAKEQDDFVTALSNRIGTRPSDEEKPEPPTPKDDPTELWKTSRAKVFAGDPKLEKEKRLGDEYFYYTSCLDDSFRTASKTLEDRIKKYGIIDDVKEWVNGQDAVFANCGEGGKMPANVPANTSEWLKKDRDYQTAAAILYSGKDADARTEFLKIANDNNSVWNKTAKFVVARTYIRQASLIDETQPDYDKVNSISNASKINSLSNTASIAVNAAANAAKAVSAAANAANTLTTQNRELIAENKAADNRPSNAIITKSVDQKKTEKQELYQKAEMQLKEILADASMKDFHPSANRLLGLVAFRAKPREQRRKLGEKLVEKTENPNFYNDLVDYIWLLDKVDSEASEAGREREQKEAEKAGKDYDYDYNLKRQDISNSELGADLTDWLFTYQAEDGFAHSYEKWKQTKSLAWLAAAISKAKKDSPNVNELLTEADKIKSDSPGFATVRHHQIRLLIDLGKNAEAKQRLTEVFPNLSKYPRSTQNDFTAQKMQLAENLDEYLKFAQRLPAAFVWSDDANEEGADLKENKELQVWNKRTMFDLDSATQFNEKMPLSVLRQAALNPNLPDHLKKFLVIAVWTRAFVLGNKTVQTEFTPLMKKFAPEYKVAAQSSDINSLLGILRNPSIQIYVPVGMGRGETETGSIDSIRGNWWCVEKTDAYTYPSFMSAAQKAEAEAEQKKIAAVGDSSTFLAKTAVDFANKNISNPSTPEILHLAVRSTRYGCKDANTLRYSKAAFDILHKRFPRSEWTKKTPYYFGEPQY